MIHNSLLNTGFIFSVVSILSLQCVCQEFIGCGGFLKSDSEINYSEIEVKLYTAQGNLKYQTDCAPNNGYFLIPIYDKGEYTLKVDPPSGWSFEPSKVELSIDGKSDPCSKSEDINFKFAGFTLTGKVISTNTLEGPAGVILDLIKSGTTEPLQSTLSTTDGSYTFEKVLPGEYTVKASRDPWTFDTSVAKYTITKGNGNIGNKIRVGGYDVKGQVKSLGKPVKGVAFLLFSDSDALQKNREGLAGCDSSTLKLDTSGRALCAVYSNEQGVFTYPSLPVGAYTVMPSYRSEQVTFDVTPKSHKLEVNHNSVLIQPSFQVEGFTVRGWVLDSEGGAGIPGVKIKVDGKPQGLSDSDGSYQLEKITSGSYVLEATKEHLTFEPLTVTVSTSSPQLPPIVASKFSVCGQVDLLGQFAETKLRRKISFRPTGTSGGDGGADPTVSDIKSDGTYCVPVTPGQYRIQVMIDEEEKKKGLRLVPDQQSVTVVSKPLYDVNFGQFTASIKGYILCRELCNTLKMTLKPLDRSEKGRDIQLKQPAKKASFIFNKVIPGRYQVLINREEWCWKSANREVVVDKVDVNNVDFEHTGYVFKVSTTHDTHLEYEFEGKPPQKDSFELKRGDNTLCLPSPGSYQLRPVSCHQFEKEVYTFDTGKPEALSVKAVKHQIRGVIEASTKMADITVDIVSSINPDVSTTLGPLKETSQSKSQSGALYQFTHWARNGESLEVTPHSQTLLFYPKSQNVVVNGDHCPGAQAKFEGREGMFIRGGITPPIEGVEVSIEVEGEAPRLILSDESGSFSLGPYHDDIKYSISAKKEGYALQQTKPGHFKASKLASISAKVQDQAGESLGGVLLSLSGDSFRSNNLTNENGSLVFAGLGPGQYFLRAMMKEFKFEPNSQIINLKEGETLDIPIKGIREAFSCYGKVTSLNGMAEAGITVEAMGLDQCAEFREDTVSDEDGSFRIQGLKPSCSYKLQVETGPDSANSQVARVIPSSQKVTVTLQDVKDVRITVVEDIFEFDLEGNIVTSHEYLTSIKVLLYREDNLDFPLHTISLVNTSFFGFPSLPRDNTRYSLRLETSLSKSLYSYVLPEASFTASSYHKHVTLMFTPEKHGYDQEMNQGSYTGLILASLLTVAVYYRNQIKQWVNEYRSRKTNRSQNSSTDSKKKLKTRKT